jgi:hypothetical protein
MEGRIDDINKAEEMAHAGKSLRDKVADKRTPLSPEELSEAERVANIRENRAGEVYEDREWGKKRAERLAAAARKEVESEGLIPESFKAEGLNEAGRKVFYTFKERDEMGLSSLWEPEALSAFSGGFRNLEEAIQAKNAEDLGNSLQTITRTLEEIGNAHNSGAFSENDESLGKVIYSLKNLQEACLNARPMVSQSPYLSIKLDRINDIAEKKWLYVAKKRDVLRAYTERRY